MFAPEISHEELQRLPLTQFEGNIHVINNYEKAQLAAEKLETQTVLGFDTESRPSFSRGTVNRVALLQLATESDAYLFRLNVMKMPKKLLEILTNPNILKIGAAIKNDLDSLKKFAKINSPSFIDLQKLMPFFEIKSLGLAKMAGIILGIRISKSQQLSNWENVALTLAQERYAATDAWVCYSIYKKLEEAKMLSVKTE
jgi:ribonuclease D